MAKKKPATPKRFRSKEARELAAAITAADGSVELTTRGHLKVTGPAGTAIVASDLATGRTLANTWATITAKTGLVPAASPTAETSGEELGNDRKPVPALRKPPPRRSGAITRWRPGDTSGFITDTDDRSWFVSRDDLPPGHEHLPEQTNVTFSGSTTPRPGKPYPQAVAVHMVVTPPENGDTT